MNRVTLDEGDGVFTAARLKDGSWNGFARPLFDRENARAFAAHMESLAGGPNGEDGERFIAVRDVFVVIDPNNPEYSRVVRPDDDGLYDFGDGYMWETVPESR